MQISLTCPHGRSGALLNCEFDRLFTSFRRSAFRLETLLEYRVPQESSAFASFIAGHCRPATLDAEWLEFISQSTDSGKVVERVHIVPHILTPYLRFEFAWGYAYTAEAGERIFVLESDHRSSVFADAPVVDFWLFDDEIAVEMRYDSTGRFQQAHEVDRSEVHRYIECRNRTKAGSMSLYEYMARRRNT